MIKVANSEVKNEKNIDERLGISVKDLIETMLRDSSCALAVMHMFRDVYGSNVQSDFIKIVKMMIYHIL